VQAENYKRAEDVIQKAADNVISNVAKQADKALLEGKNSWFGNYANA
jgi:translation initiation factor 2 alpha subunit (eIF-2alpha)